MRRTSRCSLMGHFYRLALPTNAPDGALCVGKRVLAGAFGHADPLDTHFMTRLVHHGEHVIQAAPFFTH